MLIRRLIALLRKPLKPASPPAATSLLEPVSDRAAAFDLAEFRRLLASGKAEDLQKIARAMTQPDKVQP
jgi:hypothetical protein